MASSERVYEDFVPPHQMEREPATHTITVDLSAQGYKKGHVRVQMVHSHRRLIVRGERPVDGNRWSRFRIELRIPDGCDAKAIHAKFDNGVVRVTMPGVLPEPVPVIDSVTGGTGKQQQQEPPPPPPPSSPLPKPASTAAAAGDDVQDRKGGGGGGAAEQDGGSGSGDDTGGVGEMTAASLSPRQGYGFLHNRKTATTVLGVVLALISLGIYVKYSLWP